MKEMMNKFHCKNTGLLFIRLGVAIIMIYQGYGKVMHLDQTVAFFGSIGLAPFFAYIVSFVELVGGIALLFGFYTQLATLLFAIIMLVAYLKIHMAQGFVSSMNVIVLFFASLGLFFTGPGEYSIGRGMCGTGCGCCCGNTSCTGGCATGTCETK